MRSKQKDLSVYLFKVEEEGASRAALLSGRQGIVIVSCSDSTPCSHVTLAVLARGKVSNRHSSPREGGHAGCETIGRHAITEANL